MSFGVVVRIVRGSGTRDGDRALLREFVALICDQAVSITQLCETCGGDHGQPAVSRPDTWASLARADGLLALAVSDAGPVGVDIESVAAVASFDLDAFTDGELSRLERSDDQATDAATLWCAKEAVLKADGRGLRVEPRELDVELGRESRIRVAWAADDRLRRARVFGVRFAAASGIVGVVAVLGENVGDDVNVEIQRSLGSDFE